MSARSRAVLLAVLAAGAYLVILLTVSWRSRPEVVALGQAVPVCPPLRDCPVRASVDRMEIVAGRGGALRYLVWVAYAADPSAADSVVLSPAVEVRDALGSRLPPLRELPPVRLLPGGHVLVEYRFEQVRPLVDPVLRLSTGAWWERAAGALVIGDRGSLWHAPQLLALR